MPLFYPLNISSVFMQHILLGIRADRLLPCHLWDKNPPDFISLDQHQSKVAAILLRVKTRRGMGHPLDHFLAVVKCPRFDLNCVSHPAPFCDQIEGRVKDEYGNWKARWGQKRGPPLPLLFGRLIVLISLLSQLEFVLKLGDHSSGSTRLLDNQTEFYPTSMWLQRSASLTRNLKVLRPFNL